MTILKPRFIKLLIKYSNYYKNFKRIKSTVPKELVSVIKVYATKNPREKTHDILDWQTIVHKTCVHYEKTSAIKYTTMEQKKLMNKILGGRELIDLMKFTNEIQSLYYLKDIKSLKINDDPGEYLEPFLKKASKLEIIRYNINKPITTSSKNLTKMYFGGEFNLPINDFLKNAKRLKSLNFSTVFNQKLSNLPNKLRILTLGEDFNQPLDNLIKEAKFLEKLDLFMVQRFDYQLDNFLQNAKHLKYLGLGENFNQSIDKLPDCLQTLEFHVNSKFNKKINKIPKNLKELRFGEHFNQKLGNSFRKANKLEILAVGNNFNQEISNLPKNLTELHFPDNSYFNQQLSKLPKIIGAANSSTNSELKSILPKKLKVLKLRKNYIHLKENILPKKLKVLIINTLDSQTIQIIPKNLRVLKIGNLKHSYKKYISKLSPFLTIEIEDNYYKFKKVKDLMYEKLTNEKELLESQMQNLESRKSESAKLSKFTKLQIKTLEKHIKKVEREIKSCKNKTRMRKKIYLTLKEINRKIKKNLNKKLRKIIENYSKFAKKPKYETARVIEIKEHEFVLPSGADGGLIYEEDLPGLTKLAIQKNAKRGDIIEYEPIAGYRNNGKVIFDGKQVILLDEDIDDYGSVPKEFKVLDPNDRNRHPRYWEGLIDHNYIIWFDHKKYLKELLENIKVSTYKLLETNLNGREIKKIKGKYRTNNWKLLYTHTNLQDYDKKLAPKVRKAIHEVLTIKDLSSIVLGYLEFEKTIYIISEIDISDKELNKFSEKKLISAFKNELKKDDFQFAYESIIQNIKVSNSTLLLYKHVNLYENF